MGRCGIFQIVIADIYHFPDGRRVAQALQAVESWVSSCWSKTRSNWSRRKFCHMRNSVSGIMSLRLSNLRAVKPMSYSSKQSNVLGQMSVHAEKLSQYTVLIKVILPSYKDILWNDTTKEIYIFISKHLKIKRSQPSISQALVLYSVFIHRDKRKVEKVHILGLRWKGKFSLLIAKYKNTAFIHTR